MISMLMEDGISMRITPIVAMFAGALGCISCSLSSSYCATLERRVQTEAFVDYLVEWVDENVAGRQFTVEEAIPTGGKGPGSWLVGAEIEWSEIDFDKNSQVRLVPIGGDPRSVYFGERSRAGILVQLPNASDFGVDDQAIRYSSGRVAVFCLE